MVCQWKVGFVDDQNIGDFQNVGFYGLYIIVKFWCIDDDFYICEFGYFCFGLISIDCF